MRVKIRQFAPTAHVRSLIQHRHHRQTQTPTQRNRQLFSSLNHRNRQSSHQRTSSTSTLLRQKEQSIAATHEVAGVKLFADLALFRRGHPLKHRRRRQAVRHLTSHTEHAATLLIRSRDNTVHVLRNLRVTGILEDSDRLIISLTSQPTINTGNGLTVLSGRQQERRQQILRSRVEERIRAGAFLTRTRGEMLRQILCLHLIGHIGERVPPPGCRVSSHSLRVKDPHIADLLTHTTGSIHHVTLI